MSEQISRPSLKDRIGAGRKAVSVSQQSLVQEGSLFPDNRLPLLVRPGMPGVSLSSWAENNRDWIASRLADYGGILFRGFDLPAVADFDRAVQAISGDLLEYKERSSPRHAVAGKIYTSTDYPPDQPIFLHNENSYQKVWPLRIFFYCLIPSATGGETPIADTRRVYERIDPEIRDRFIAKKWMYVRNFGDGFGLPWQSVFQTDNKAEVEAHCTRNNIQFEWKEGDRLRTRAVRRAATPHPLDGQMVWFNHATFFHVSTLTPAIREALLEEFGEEDLPANTYYGDGSRIEPEVLDHLRACYAAETVAFPWQQGDLLMLDNMKVAHARAPFTGERKILVGMSHPQSLDDLPA
ncbi:MAG TPA: TauD/TfdA family dioxygenase [Thermoanaerobaculia bacterium]